MQILKPHDPSRQIQLCWLGKQAEFTSKQSLFSIQDLPTYLTRPGNEVWCPHHRFLKSHSGKVLAFGKFSYIKVF